MKKILTIVCCTFVLFSVSSCTKQYITPNPDVVSATLAPSDWTLYTDGKSYQAPITVPAIGSGFAQYGSVSVAISYVNGASYVNGEGIGQPIAIGSRTFVYEQIPEVYDGISYSYTYNAGKVSGNVPGTVTIYAQSADGTTPVHPTQNIYVKITMARIVTGIVPGY